jgi:hypothetical protein
MFKSGFSWLAEVGLFLEEADDPNLELDGLEYVSILFCFVLFSLV